SQRPRAASSDPSKVCIQGLQPAAICPIRAGGLEPL
ncbi:hypothetical protein AK812_SmicGene47643, partial [Symbiodinium microadriaticum]